MTPTHATTAPGLIVSTEIDIPGGETILTTEALDFVAELQARFGRRRNELLQRRTLRRDEVSRTHRMDFLPETADIRAADWSVAPAPADLLDRRVEMTGPTDRKMTINALNSGAKVWLADMEDASTPHWRNVVGGQVNLYDAVRPLVDFGLYFFHNAAELLERGSGPYFYLPKMESHLEARLWNDIFTFAQQRLGIPHGTIRATVLIETIPAAFEMDEILYELRDHASGLNAGRWDYLFSIIKYFRDSGPSFVLPDRNAVKMTAPFMRAYAQLLVKTCHRRGAFAIGGMSAFIPSRRDPVVNKVAFAQVRADKEREAGDGFDGSWVAHPDLVPVCREVFDAVLGDRPNQLGRQRPDVDVSADDLLDITSTPGAITAAGLAGNVNVAVLYLASWLRGGGAVAINNLMEDAATAEISRSQIWQWVYNGSVLEDGRTVTTELVRQVVADELAEIRQGIGEDAFAAGMFGQAGTLFEAVSLDDSYAEFLTLPAYEVIR